jgi:hypothetical protein
LRGDKDLKLRIGVKYCGGCNPEYDRVALIKSVQERLAVKADFVSWENKDIDQVLVLCGCSTSCVDLSQFTGLKTLMIKNPDDVEPFLRMTNTHEA